MSGSFHKSEPIINSLRLSARESIELLTRLQEEADAFCGNERRNNDRVPIVEESGITVQLRHPGGSVVNVRVLPRNISPTGIGFLHGGFVYVGTKLVVQLRRMDGFFASLGAVVTQCRHLRGSIHEIGARFANPIEVREYANVDIAANHDPESALALLNGQGPILPSFFGRLIVVDGCDDERELLKFELESLGVTVHCASQLSEVGSLNQTSGFDAVIVGVDQVSPELRVFLPLKQAGFTGKAVAVTADERPEMLTQLQQEGYDQVLHSPLDTKRIAALLETFLPKADPVAVAQSAKPLLSSKWSNHRMRPLIQAFVMKLEEQLRQVEGLLADAQQRPSANHVLLAIKSAGGGYGYPTLSRAADELLKLIQQNASVAVMQMKLRELRTLSESARLPLLKAAS